MNTLPSARDKKLANSLDRPAALIARDHTVLFSNIRLRGKFSYDVVGLRMGRLLDCKHVASLGGCRETVACLHCKLKRLIELTSITGEKLSEISISVQHKSGATHIFKITTEQAGEAVLLTIAGFPENVQGGGKLHGRPRVDRL